MQVSIALVAASSIRRSIILLFVDFFQLTKYDSGGNDTVPIIIVVYFMKVPERRDTFEHILDSIMLAEVWNELSMIHDPGGSPVLGKSTETAGSNRKYGVEKMRVVVSSPRDNKLKMAIFVTQVELVKSIRCQMRHCVQQMWKRLTQWAISSMKYLKRQASRVSSRGNRRWRVSSSCDDITLGT